MNEDEQLMLALALSQSDQDSLHTTIPDKDYSLNLPPPVSVSLEEGEIPQFSEHHSGIVHEQHSLSEVNPIHHSTDYHDADTRFDQTQNGFIFDQNFNFMAHLDNLPLLAEYLLQLEQGETCSNIRRTLDVWLLPKGEAENLENQDTLKFRISKLNLVVKRMPNDGNCQFSSISHQLYGTWKNHYEVRHAAVTQLIAHQDFYRKFVPVNYDVYCSEMQQNTIWGDNVTLQAISDYFGVHIKLVTSIRNCPFVEIVPHEKKLEKVLLLSYFRATHYNSLLTKQEAMLLTNSAPQPQKKCLLQ